MNRPFYHVIAALCLMLLLTAFNVHAEEIIPMKKESSGIYTIPCDVNGLKLRFIFDTGASSVSISLTEAAFMLKNGYLDDSDIIGMTNVQTADGNIAENYTVNLKELKIGSVVLNNVKAVVSKGLDAPLLLGQSVLDKLGHWSIKNGSLVLNQIVARDEDKNYSWEEFESMLKNNKTEAIALLREYVKAGDVNAAYLFLSHVVSPSESGLFNLNDPDIIQSMNILENQNNVNPNDMYGNLGILIWFSLYRLNDIQRAVQYTRKVENLGYLLIEDYDKLWDSILLHSGWGSKSQISSELAEELFSKGYYQSYCTYATYLQDVEKQPSKAFYAYKKASDKGHIPSSIKLGICYLDGVGTTRNATIGLSLLDEAANKGYIDAITELCARYYYGNGVSQNYDKVLSTARMFGHEGICDILNKAYTGIAYFAKKDYRFALQELQEIDLISDESMSDNMRLAWNRGLNRISNEILCAVGQCYEQGLGCKLDFNLAFKYYNKLVEHDPSWGYGMLGDMFFLNQLIETDAERAYQYYVLGANNDSGYCCFRLALMNYYGVGTYKNEIKAKEYKAKALKHGFKQEDFQF